MGIKFNPLSGKFDLVNDELSEYGEKIKFHLSSMSALDKIVSITYLDQGIKSQRVSSIVMSSASFPNVSMTKSIFYFDIGSIKQRIDRVEYSGSVLGSDILVKTFNYSLSGIRYKLDNFEYEII